MPILIASVMAFLSGQESVTNNIFIYIYLSNCGFVKIPGGYLPAKTLDPVIFPNSLTDFHPFSLLLTIKISSGAYWAKKLLATFILSSIFCRFKTDKPSGL